MGRDRSPPAKLRDEVERDRGRLAVVLVPTSWDIEPAWKQWLFNRLPKTVSTATFDFDLPYREIGARLAKLGVPMLDLRPAFRQAAKDDVAGPLYDETGHWSAPGHAVAARAVAPFLADQITTMMR